MLFGFLGVHRAVCILRPKCRAQQHSMPSPASTWPLMTLDGPATHSPWVEQKRLLCAWGGVWAGEGASVPLCLCHQFAHARSGRDPGQWLWSSRVPAGSPEVLCVRVGWQVWAQVVHVWSEGSCSPAWDKLPLESDAFPRGSPSALGQACWPLLLLLLSAFSLGWGHSVWMLILPSTALSLPSRPFCRVAGMSFGQQPCLLKQKVVLG